MKKYLQFCKRFAWKIFILSFGFFEAFRISFLYHSLIKKCWRQKNLKPNQITFRCSYFYDHLCWQRTKDIIEWRRRFKRCWLHRTHKHGLETLASVDSKRRHLKSFISFMTFMFHHGRSKTEDKKYKLTEFMLNWNTNSAIKACKTKTTN